MVCQALSIFNFEEQADSLSYRVFSNSVRLCWKLDYKIQ